MKDKIGKYLGLFLLFVFLFPVIEKEIHSIDHANDFRCTEKSKVHFHETEHQCTICDFNVNTPFTLTYFNDKFQLFLFNSLNLSYHSEIVIPFPNFFFSLKAPPIFS